MFFPPQYFTKCFKEEFGMKPTEYQNQRDRCFSVYALFVNG
ncbi:MAG: AraC family transcriptional regulator [Tannerella sp.]|nr:AraC family transcriptional regulator [Tannerella sp.]